MKTISTTQAVGTYSANVNQPQRVLVTKITYLNGEENELYTAIPKGLFVAFIQDGLNASLKTQSNIYSFESKLFESENGEIMEETESYSKVILTEENRLPIPSEYQGCSFNVGVTKSVY